MDDTTSRGGSRSAFGLIAGALFVIGPALAALRLIPGLLGFVLFALGGLIGLVVGVLSVIQALRGRGLGRGGAIALGVGIVFFTLASRGFGVPRINDFTTDASDPPAFTHATTLPANAGRNMSYPPGFAEIQHTCCADLHPAHVRASAEEAFGQAERAARAMPSWEIVWTDPRSGLIEAVATSRLFGFHDDVVIRVRPDSDGASRIDMRSKSRDGQGDFGVNAARIRAYVTAVEAGK